MIKIKLFLKPAFFAVLLSICLSGNVMAQDSGTVAPPKSEWNFLVEPYMLFPNMSGTVGLGDLYDVTLDANSNDILGQLKMGFMLNAEASNGKWTIGSDLLYMNLAQGVKPGVLIQNGELSVKQLGWELSGLYTVNPWLDLGIGGMLNSIYSGGEIYLISVGGWSSATKKTSMTKTWFDPILIARIQGKSAEKFIYQLRGEIGGFGIGSDFAWQMQAYAGYRFSKLFQITGGYRIISLDYETGSGANRFMYNVDTSGPVLRFGFNF